MGKSIDPMLKEKAGSGCRAHSRRSSASMSLQPVIPRRVALQQSPPPLVFSNRKMSLKEAKGRRSGFFLSFSD